MGAVLHTLNLRLHPDQLRFIMADAQDSVLTADGEVWAFGDCTLGQTGKESVRLLAA